MPVPTRRHDRIRCGAGTASPRTDVCCRTGQHPCCLDRVGPVSAGRDAWCVPASSSHKDRCRRVLLEKKGDTRARAAPIGARDCLHLGCGCPPRGAIMSSDLENLTRPAWRHPGSSSAGSDGRARLLQGPEWLMARDASRSGRPAGAGDAYGVPEAARSLKTRGSGPSMNGIVRRWFPQEASRRRRPAPAAALDAAVLRAMMGQQAGTRPGSLSPKPSRR